MKKNLLATLVLSSSIFASNVAAEETSVELSSNVSYVSQYVFRGDVFNDKPSIQGGFDLSYGDFYAGTWGATDAAAGTEVDYYFGYGFEVGGVALDLGFITYTYENIEDANLDELYLGADFGFAAAKVSFGDGYEYIEASKGFEISEQVSVDLRAGYLLADDNFYDIAATLNYAINDAYSAVVSLSNKEDGDTEVFFGISAGF